MEDDSVPPFRCPRCGSHDVDDYSERFSPPGAVSAYEDWKQITYHCNKCDLWEEDMNGDPDRDESFGRMVERWHNPEWKFKP